MRLLRDVSIKGKLIAIIALAGCAAQTICTFAFMQSHHAERRSTLKEELGSLAAVLSSSVAAVLVLEDKDAAQELLQQLDNNPRLAASAVFTGRKQLFASRQHRKGAEAPMAAKPSAGDGESMEWWSPVRHHGRTVGYLFLRADAASHSASLEPFHVRSFLVALAGLLLTLLFSIVLQRFISEPILELASLARRVTDRQDYSLRAGKSSGDEIGQLIDSFNSMLAAIESRDGDLARQRDELEMQVAARTADLLMLNRQLASARDRAEAATRLKSEFLANMSHEIRTPMNGIMGLTDLTLQSSLTAEQRKNLNLVKSSADSLLTVINDILDFSKVEAGKLTLDEEPFMLCEVTSETMRMLAVRAHEKGLEIAVVGDPRVPHRLIGDANRLRQVLVNLIGNSIKFTERGEVSLFVRVCEAGADGVLLEFRIADTGIGIPSERLATIFESFTQADGSISRRFGGTGLGLAITTRLVQLMGGEMAVRSELGNGSEFCFTARFRLSLEDAGEQAASPLLGQNVLVLEGHATSRESLLGILAHAGALVTAGESYADAQRILESHRTPFDLAFVDAGLPGGDGLAVAAKLQECGVVLRAVPLVRSNVSNSLRRRAEHLGMPVCLTKPVCPVEIGNAFAAGGSMDAPVPLAASPPEAESLRRLSILLAEDNLVNQRLAVKLLEKRGHRVTVAGNGEEALRVLGGDQFDVVLMDIQMPVMDGMQAVARLREQERRSGGHLPVIALTAHAMKDDEARCLAAGMDGYVSKPIHPAELYAMIARVLG
ncbi:MAG: response regulator [Bryobacterales bacterium]|nr:response regulator [Bryobacterales bacterium]